MEKRQELLRLTAIFLFLVLLIGAFFYVLYDLQVVRKDEFLARTTRSIGKAEEVAAARGPISDRYGRALVTNQVVYQVTLDTSLMGERKNDLILELIHLAQEQNVPWPDSLPITTKAPYTSRLAALSDSAQKNFNSLAKTCKWKSPGGAELLKELRTYYKVDEALSDDDARLLIGVLYELSLRSKEVIWPTYIFAEDVDMTFISKVRERQLTGVNISPVTTRKYNTTYAAHLLGRTAKMDGDEWQTYKELGYSMDEIVGKDGVEKAFESVLRGTAGVQVVERNTAGKIVSQTWREEPQPGGNVLLTIDLPLQQKVEDTLASKLPSLTDYVEGGAAVMMDVNSGAVLAMASYPTFDLTTIYKNTEEYNAASNDPLHPFNNRATLGVYAPGSTFKPMVATAALQEGIIEPNTKIKDTGVYRYYKSPQPACWIWRQFRSTHGSISVSKAIEVSCNVFFYDVGRRTGIQTIDEYARKFGLGEYTGIEIPESRGVLAGPEYTESRGQIWYEGNVLSAAIGQENNQFTPVQMANYTATLANGGTHYAAHLLKEVRSADGSQTLQTYEPQVLNRVEFEEENLAAIKKGMLDLTTTGSLSRYFRGLPFQVGAKTGSVQVGKDESNATFICFAPFDDPQVALVLVAEQGGSGSGLAELAADILSFYLDPQTSAPTAVAENTLLS